MLGLPKATKDDLIVHSAKPFNAEPALARLRSDFVTAIADCYVRSHGDLPRIDPGTHRLRVTGHVSRQLELSLADLQGRFATRSVMAVMQCAGNRRADLQQVEPTLGDPWGPGAIANLMWTGASLAEVLRAAGADHDPLLHVAFEAADIAENEGGENARYGVSIPMPKALSDDVLVAWAMNGEPLTVEHGAPLRIVVPGYAGVRSAKWVREIRVQCQPSDAFQQQKDYLLFPPDIRKDTQDSVGARRSMKCRSTPPSANLATVPRCRADKGRSSAAMPSRPIERLSGSTCPGTAAAPGGRPRSNSTATSAGAGPSGMRCSICRKDSTNSWFAHGMPPARPSPQMLPTPGTSRAICARHGIGSGSRCNSRRACPKGRR